MCFGNFHVPRVIASTADTVACVSGEDKVEVKDGTTVLLTCCGTKCFRTIYKLASQTAETTYTVVLTLGSKDTYKDARWNVPNLANYRGIDIVDFQVSSLKNTLKEGILIAKSVI